LIALIRDTIIQSPSRALCLSLHNSDPLLHETLELINDLVDQSIRRGDGLHEAREAGPWTW
jgi:hypothetical protein